MARVIAGGTGAERAELWPGAGDELHVSASWPNDAYAIEAADRVVEVAHEGRVLGEIRVRKPAGEPFAAPEDKLLQDLASQAGMVVRNVGLTSQLRERVDELSLRAAELKASRARIVAAHDRLDAIGGDVRVRSEPGRGTTVTGTVPAAGTPS
jgi:hypothetical protein